MEGARGLAGGVWERREALRRLQVPPRPREAKGSTREALRDPFPWPGRPPWVGPRKRLPGVTAVRHGR